MTNTRFANVSVELRANWIHDYSALGELEKMTSRIDLSDVLTDLPD